jgi:hypothetical protein
MLPQREVSNNFVREGPPGSRTRDAQVGGLKREEEGVGGLKRGLKGRGDFRVLVKREVSLIYQPLHSPLSIVHLYKKAWETFLNG